MAKTSCKKGHYYCNTDQKCKPIPDGYKVREDGILVSEGSLHKWFKGSKSKDGKGGWVNVLTGGTCASDEPGEGVPKCVSRAKYERMTPAERRSAARRKKEADPGQQEKTGAAKPTYVKTDKKMTYKKKKKKTKKESTEFISLPLVLEVPQNDAEFRLGLMFRESLEKDRGMLFIFESNDYWTFHMKNTFIPLDIAFIKEDGTIESIKELDPMNPVQVGPDSDIRYAVEVNRGWFAENGVVVGDRLLEEEDLTEGKDKKGKGSGTKDACYHKVKSRYSVWPSAYASGALVKCRKVGAANWGNSRKEEVEYEAKVYKTSHHRWRDELEEHHQKDKDGNPITHEGGSVPFSGKGDREGNPIEESKSNWRQELVKKTKKEELEVEVSSVEEKKEYNPNAKKDGAFDRGVDKLLGILNLKKINKNVKKIDEQLKDTNWGRVIGNQKNKTTKNVKITPSIMQKIRLFNLGASYEPDDKEINETAIESELTIQDWNIDEIKYTEIEAVDIIKPEPLKPSPSNWRADLGEDWQKVNRKDKTDGMSQKAVDAYKRENPGSKLKTAVTGKVKKGSKASKRRKSFCARSDGQRKMHNIDCKKTPNKKICKARRRWKC